jgi:hypothetical protein
MASSPGLNFLIAKYLRDLPNPHLANVRDPTTTDFSHTIL